MAAPIAPAPASTMTGPIIWRTRDHRLFARYRGPSLIGTASNGFLNDILGSPDLGLTLVIGSLTSA